jgi:hypothetical protein
MAVAPQEILDARNDPAALERLYRADAKGFTAALALALKADPAAIALRVWQVRLASDVPDAPAVTERRGGTGDVLLVLFLCLVSGTIAKLPAFAGRYDDDEFYARNIGFLFLPALAGYFLARNVASTRKSLVVVTLFVIAALTANAYPKPDDSQSVTLALLHLPFVLWAVVGYAFAPAPWSGVGWRTDYLRLNGEAVVYTALVLITGMLMTAITMALFHAIKVDVDQWYGGWVAVYGACSAPIVGMHLALTRMRAGFAIAPLIARIFSPLALLILMAYLGAMVLQGRSPYGEREFLIVFNGMLLSVLGIAVFCICERRAGRFSDAVLCALLIVALVIDLIALSAILYRLASFGFTPNRIATLVANVLVFVHLAGILVTFLPAARRSGDAEAAQRWIARFLPTYAVWSAIVVFLFPLLFRFR